MPGLHRYTFVPAPDSLQEAARLLVDLAGWESLPDWRILTPSLPLAADFRRALLQLATERKRPFLTPRLDTLARWAKFPTSGIPANHPSLPLPLPDSARLVLLYQALKTRNWFETRALWGVAAEVAALFDELTEHALELPEDEAALAVQLEAAYPLHDSEPLRFEARVVHELWRTLNHLGTPSETAVKRMRLAAKAMQAGENPLFVVCAHEPLDEEMHFFTTCAQQAPVHLLLAQPFSRNQTALAQVLHAAWPTQEQPDKDNANSPLSPSPLSPPLPLAARAQALLETCPASPLGNRLALLAHQSLESEATAIVAQVLAWLGEDQAAGRNPRRIALVAQDRLCARRVRALLERHEVLAADEAGWKLSTSRSAALVDALLQVVGSGETNAYYADVLDLLKSPAVDAGLDSMLKSQGLYFLERAIRTENVVNGFPALNDAVLKLQYTTGGSPAAKAALHLLQSTQKAAACLDKQTSTSIAGWIENLQKAFAILQVNDALQSDAAGETLLALLETRRSELKDTAGSFSFYVWREWLDRELEAENFRDSRIKSPVVMTSLAATRLRPFDAAILIGGDALRPTARGIFFNQNVRRELHLPTLDTAVAELRGDLALLLQTVPQVIVSWQNEHAGEHIPLAGDLDQLSLLHHLAYGDDLIRRPALPPSVPAPSFGAFPLPQAGTMPMPPAPLALLPASLSVSACQTLISCPYRFFALYLLHADELASISEIMEKSDYGNRVHEILETFHLRHPRIETFDDTTACEMLAGISDEIFEPELEKNPAVLAWLIRWKKQIPVYIAWQKANEKEGWLWQRGEIKVQRHFVLDDGSPLEIHGRIDRIDANSSGERLLDYKTQKETALKKRRASGEDVQLPLYILLRESEESSADETAEALQDTPVVLDAAYLALEETPLKMVDSGIADDINSMLQAHETRLIRIFSNLRRAAPLPANGSETVCQWCEVRGLCRKNYWLRKNDEN